MMHATVVSIGGRGVLLAGGSGRGKSDLALRLIDRGAVLVADDYAEYEVFAGSLIARAPVATAGLIEIRGVGLERLSHQDAVVVALFVDLDPLPERLPELTVRDVRGVAIPEIALAALEASAPLKVEAALRRFGLAVECVPE